MLGPEQHGDTSIKGLKTAGLIAVLWAIKETVSFVGDVFGIATDAPEALSGANVAWPSAQWWIVSTFAIVVGVVLIWIWPPRLVATWLIRVCYFFLGEPINNRRGYYWCVAIGGLIMSAGIVFAARNPTSALIASFVVGLVAFATTFLFVLAAQTDCATASQQRDQYKSEADASQTTIEIVKKRYCESLQSHLGECKRILGAWRNNEKTIAELKPRFDNWLLPRANALFDATPFGLGDVSEHLIQFEIPLDVKERNESDKGSTGFYSDLKRLEIRLEAAIKALR